MKKLLLLLLLLSNAGCATFAFLVQFAPGNKYKMNQVYESARFTNYAIGKIEKTPSGVAIDHSGQEVNFERVDQLTAELESCLAVSIERRAFLVKVPDDWRYEECASRQLFPCQLPEFETGCDDPTCPCGCAGILQWPQTVITTPNLASYKHELIHLILHTVNHSNPAFKRCQ